MPYNRRLPMHRIEKWLIVVVPPLVCAAVAAGLGLDANWDLRNYHYYNAYAFLNGRLGHDVAPGQMQTFHNPLPDLPFYWLAQSWPPIWIGAVLGALHGLNLTLLWGIFLETTEWSQPRHRWAIGVLVLWMALRAPGFQSELGSTMNDNLVSLFVLAGVWLLLTASREASRVDQARVALAGAVMGAGFGLKLTLFPYVVSAAVALAWLWPTARSRWQALAVYGVAGVVGTLATAGAWSWQLWTAFGNPTFPYLNSIFQSPYAAPWSFADTRFLPGSTWEYLAWPFVFAVNPLRVSEQPFRDIRFAVLYGLAIAAVIQVARRHAAGVPAPNHLCRRGPARFLALFAFVAFVLWMTQFSIYRYLIPLEVLAPLLAVIAIDAIFAGWQARLEIGGLVTLAALTVFQPLDWGRAHWPGRYIEVRNVSALGLTDRSVVMLLGTAPLSYIIPSFPPAVRFVRPEGNLGLGPTDALSQQISSALAAADKVFAVYLAGDEAVSLPATLARWGLEGAGPDCGRLDTNIPDNLVVCGLTPTSR